MMDAGDYTCTSALTSMHHLLIPFPSGLCDTYDSHIVICWYRWCDKSFSLFVTPKGDASVNFEHAWGDGVAVMSYFNAVFKDSNEKPAASDSNVAANIAPKVNKLG